MATKIVYSRGDEESLIQGEGTKSLSSDQRLVDALGRAVQVQDNGEFGTVVLYDHLSAKEFKINGLNGMPRIDFTGQFRTGEALHLPHVRSVANVTPERIA